MGAAVGALAGQAAGLREAGDLVLRGPVRARGLTLSHVCGAGHLLQRLGDQLPGLLAHHRLENRLRLDENLEGDEAYSCVQLHQHPSACPL